MHKKNIKIINLRDYISYQEYLHLKENNLTDYYLDSYFKKGGANPTNPNTASSANPSTGDEKKKTFVAEKLDLIKSAASTAGRAVKDTAKGAVNMGSKIATDAANSASKFIEKKRQHQEKMAKIAGATKIRMKQEESKNAKSGGPVAINIGNQGQNYESNYENLLKEQDKAKVAGIENLEKCQELFINKVIEGVMTYLNLRSPYKNIINPVMKEELKEALDKKIDRLIRSGGVADARSAVELNTKMLKICQFSKNDIVNQFDSFLNENKNFKSVVREINLSNNKLSTSKRIKQEMKDLLKI